MPWRRVLYLTKYHAMEVYPVLIKHHAMTMYGGVEV
jgi:hypothetical protein